MQHVFLGPPGMDAAATEAFRVGLEKALTSQEYFDEAERVLSYAPGFVGYQRQAEIFAHSLGSELDKIRQCSNLHRIYLVAAPKFLGLLRTGLSKQCTELLVVEVNKDLVNHRIEDIRSHLPKRL